MATAKKESDVETIKKPDAPCFMCGSIGWCDCEWDTFVPSLLFPPFIQHPQKVASGESSIDEMLKIKSSEETDSEEKGKDAKE